MKMIEVKNLTKVIKGKRILDNISFEVEMGQIVGLVGINGSGKSTLLKCMVGLYSIDSGSVSYNGYDLKSDYEKSISNVGCVIENVDMYKDLSGKTNLDVFKTMFKGIDEETIKDIVRIVDMEKSLGKKFKFYSLGMKERMGIINALISKPNVLILDEPTNGLDPLGIRNLRELLISLKKTTILISSHILSEIEAICDKVMFINDGKLLSIKDISKQYKKHIEFEVDNYSKAKLILNNYSVGENLDVYESDEIVSEINKELINNNINVYRIREKSDLENDFLCEFGGVND